MTEEMQKKMAEILGLPKQTEAMKLVPNMAYFLQDDNKKRGRIPYSGRDLKAENVVVAEAQWPHHHMY